MVPDLCASKGDDMVKLLSPSRLRMYTNFCFSTEPMVTARPTESSRGWKRVWDESYVARVVGNMELVNGVFKVL